VTTIEGAIVSILNSNSGVTTLVSNRIAPATDPQNLPLPKLTYQRLRTDRDTESGGFSNSGPTGHAVATFQIDCWCQSLLTAKQTISAVRTALNGYTGTSNGITIGCIRVIDEKELPGGIYPGQQKPIQRQMLEISVQFAE
jgi:hypothetical protein